MAGSQKARSVGYSKVCEIDRARHETRKERQWIGATGFRGKLQRLGLCLCLCLSLSLGYE